MPASSARVISDFNRIGVPEVHLRKVRPVHLPYIYGDFHEVVGARLALITGNDPQSAELRRFFEYVLTEIDADEYRRVQLHYLDPGVVDVYGQWQGKNQQTPERIRSKMLIIDYPQTPENAARIEAIRAAWKQKTGDQSVLKVTQPADVSF